MQAEQGSQLTGVIIGASIAAFVALVGHVVNVFNTWLTSKKETEQWRRQQNADRDKRRHEEKKADRERRREIYLNSLTCLTQLMSANEGKTPLPPEELRKRVEETLKWLNLLSLPYRVDENAKVEVFHVRLEEFIGSPLGNAGEMKEAVADLAMTDKTLFPNAPEEPEITTIEKPSQETITFQMAVDDEFRKEQIIKGVVVPQSNTFTFSLADLSEDQRELLANIYFFSYKTIPHTIQLPMPSSKPNPTHPYSSGLAWKGRCNPVTTSPTEMLKMWETDYREAFKKLNTIPPAE
jgi:hypothetical protein